MWFFHLFTFKNILLSLYLTQGIRYGLQFLYPIATQQKVLPTLTPEERQFFEENGLSEIDKPMNTGPLFPRVVWFVFNVFFWLFFVLFTTYYIRSLKKNANKNSH